MIPRNLVNRHLRDRATIDQEFDWHKHVIDKYRVIR
jgi:hypothetical protein